MDSLVLRVDYLGTESVGLNHVVEIGLDHDGGFKAVGVVRYVFYSVFGELQQPVVLGFDVLEYLVVGNPEDRCEESWDEAESHRDPVVVVVGLPCLRPFAVLLHPLDGVVYFQ